VDPAHARAAAAGQDEAGDVVLGDHGGDLSLRRAAPRRARSPADVAHLDAAAPGAGVRGQGPAQLRIPVVAALPDVADRRSQFLVARAAAQQRAQVVAVAREEAQVHLALGGQARAVAVAAEGLRDAADEAHFPLAVGIAPALG